MGLLNEKDRNIWPNPAPSSSISLILDKRLGLRLGWGLRIGCNVGFGVSSMDPFFPPGNDPEGECKGNGNKDP